MSVDEASETMAEEAPSSRRSLLAKGAMAAAVATVAGLAMSKETNAADGGPLLIGTANTGTVTTALAGGSTLQVTDGGSTTNFKSSVYGIQTVNARIGVTGESTAATGGTGVLGRNTSSTGFGVHGLNLGNNGIAVYGEHNDSTLAGTGVVGRSNGGAGVAGDGLSYDFSAIGSGRLNLKAGGFSNPPTGNFAGTIASDTVGNLWYSPSNGVFQKLNTVPSTAGTFVSIAPVRVFDSRSALPAPGKIVAGTPRVVSVKDGRDQTTGSVTAADAIPVGAVAIFFNLTVTDTENSGFLSVVPGDAAAASGSSINWFGPGQNLANGLIGKIDANRQVKVFVGGGGTTHFVIDVTGYYL